MKKKEKKRKRARWPSGLRRWFKAPVRKGKGSNPFLVTIFFFSSVLFFSFISSFLPYFSMSFKESFFSISIFPTFIMFDWLLACFGSFFLLSRCPAWYSEMDLSKNGFQSSTTKRKHNLNMFEHVWQTIWRRRNKWWCVLFVCFSFWRRMNLHLHLIFQWFWFHFLSKGNKCVEKLKKQERKTKKKVMIGFNFLSPLFPSLSENQIISNQSKIFLIWTPLINSLHQTNKQPNQKTGARMKMKLSSRKLELAKGNHFFLGVEKWKEKNEVRGLYLLETDLRFTSKCDKLMRYSTTCACPLSQAMCNPVKSWWLRFLQ